jgi:hypothetical protein
MNTTTTTVTVELESAVGPRVLVAGEVEASDVELEVPVGWAVDWSNGVRIGVGDYQQMSYPLVEAGDDDDADLVECAYCGHEVHQVEERGAHRSRPPAVRTMRPSSHTRSPRTNVVWTTPRSTRPS